jgi:hypothetical protein
MGQPMEQIQQTTQHVVKKVVDDGSVLDFATDYPGVMVLLVGVLFGLVLKFMKRRGASK